MYVGVGGGGKDLSIRNKILLQYSVGFFQLADGSVVFDNLRHNLFLPLLRQILQVLGILALVAKELKEKCLGIFIP